MSDSNYDNRLEQLSRNAADGYTPPGNAASWEKMEAALDKVMPVEEKKRRRFIFWWLFPLALIGTGIIYTVWPDNTVISSLPAAKDQNSITESETKNTLQKEQQKDSPNTSTISPETEKNNTAFINTHAAGGAINKQKIVRKHTTTANIWETKPSSVISNSSGQTDVPTQSVVKNIVSNPITTTTDAVTKTVPANTNTVYSITPAIDSGSKKAVTGIIEKTDTAINHQLVITDSLQTDSTISKPEKTTNSKLSIAFVAGMDASTVKYKYSDKAGINIGILAGYHFNDHWSMHTGVLFTRKNYTVAGEDFQVPKNSWLANYKLDMVDGYCNMWEVPLFVRYQFNANNKRSFFLSTGISSYFMTRENYNYAYYFNGQLLTRNNNYPTGNTHLLSILRLSAGWRKPIGKSSSILVEPYAALPLGGVGFGSIRLSSYGLNFSLQIRQPSKKK